MQDPRNRSAADPQTVYDAVGGMPFFEGLAERFYAGVADDAELLAMYPEPDDLTGARQRLSLFLAQYWGGPTTYSDQRGHPRLRMRHHPFVVDQAARDAWMRHMTQALATSPDLDPTIAAQMTDYFTMAANHLINSH